jgi:hypothetical protein
VAKISDTDRLSAFVRRLRRIEAHPLIAADGGDLVRELSATKFKPYVDMEAKDVVLRFDLPDEVQFESLAARLRPMTLASDTLGHAKVMDALDALTDTTDKAIAASNAQLRQQWSDATERDRTRGAKTRAYRVGVQDIETGETASATDLDLAYAWLYEDSVHGDLPSYDEFDARDRYSAAIHVFAHIAVVALETLAYIRFLVENGHLSLPAEAFEVDVVVDEPKWEQRGHAYFGPPGEVPDALDIDYGTAPEGMRPIHEMFEPTISQDADQKQDPGHD